MMIVLFLTLRVEMNKICTREWINGWKWISSDVGQKCVCFVVLRSNI